MIIRAAEPGDTAALIGLWVDAWQVAMPQIDFQARRGWLDDRLTGLAAQGAAILVAIEAGDPIGFVTVDQDGQVDQLVVSIDQQGRGVAARLIETARAYAQGGLRLSVNADNTRAVAFYERQGFRSVGYGTNGLSGLPVLNMEG